MSPLTPLFKAIAFLSLSVLAAVAALSGPTASFTTSTPNPAANCLVQFTDTSSGGPTSWAWDFGDGSTAADQNATHSYATPGAYTVRLTASNASGSASSTLDVMVTDPTVLRLNAAHTFDLTLTATDPRTGNVGSGQVIGQNDVYGYFSIPSVSGNAGNPEVIVKMVDATGIGQNYWVFYGCMTDLEYTLSVTENATGIVKKYSKDAAKPCGQFDTSGFLPTATPTQTPLATATPVATTTPVATATPTGPTVEDLFASDFQWSFADGGGRFTAHVGTTYELHIIDTDPPGTNAHGFSGIPQLRMSGGILTPGGQTVLVRSFTPTSSQVGFFPFACSEDSCGIGHDGMVAVIQVVP
jgi:PKD repeat protein